MHESMLRLLEHARRVTAGSGTPIQTIADLRGAMGVSPQVMTNWNKRGISKEGAIDAERLFGIPAAQLRAERGNTDSKATFRYPASAGSHSAVGESVRNYTSGSTAQHEGERASLESPFKVLSVPPILSWEDLMKMETLPAKFRLEMRDNAMAPLAGEGTLVEFNAAPAAKFGDAVLVRDNQGRLYFRELCELADGWEARPTNPTYATLRSTDHRLEIVGVCEAITRRGNWAELSR